MGNQKESKRNASKHAKRLYTFESPHEGLNPQSLGHAKYLLKFGLKIDIKNPVGIEEIEIQDFDTRKKQRKKPKSITCKNCVLKKCISQLA